MRNEEKIPGSAIFRLILAGILLSAIASAEPTQEHAPLDIGVKLGVALGSVEQASPSANVNYGGFPIAVEINFDLSTEFTLEAELGMIADLANSQVTRTGVDAEGIYHLLGGARRTQTDYGSFLEVTRNPYNFSVLARLGFDHYSGSTGTSTNPAFQGSVFALAGGVQYRYDLNDSLALVLELYSTLFNIPASTERLKAHITEGVASLRFFL